MTDGPRKICFVTGSRADFGLLIWPMRAIQQTARADAATHRHRHASVPGIRLHHRQYPRRKASTSTTPSKRCSAAIPASASPNRSGSASSGSPMRSRGSSRISSWCLATATRRLRRRRRRCSCDCRWRICSAATSPKARSMNRSAMRSARWRICISRRNADSTRRLVQLGEDPSRIFTVGSPGIDAIKRLKLMDRETMSAAKSEWLLGERNVLVTFHPATVEADQSVGALDEIVRRAFNTRSEGFRLFFTLANADAEGRALNDQIQAFVSTRPAERHGGGVAWATSLHQPDERGRRRGRQLLERHL